MANEHVVELTLDNWETEVKNSEVPVLVDIWAPWCGPCRMLSPTIDSVAEKFAGKAKVGKLNMDENQEIAVRYNVSAIPALLFFPAGSDEVAHKIAGVEREDKIAAQLDQMLGA